MLLPLRKTNDLVAILPSAPHTRQAAYRVGGRRKAQKAMQPQR